ncbi:valine--tRNA ligase, partial [Klebsiella pneumoniae]|nr:valine--tRNA ligase [Klebsiella pneumoniae]
LKWMFTPRFGMFGEYRFTHYRADLQDDVYVTYPPVSGSLHVKSTLDTHHVLVGFALLFN